MGDEELIVQDIVEGCIEEWENDMNGEIFPQMNEWAASYRMKNTLKDPRPNGVSKNMSAETPRAVNALATSITRMQTAQDPPFECRADQADEDTLYDIEKAMTKELTSLEFKRKLLKGNRGMCLFGTQVWEEPYVSFPFGMTNPWAVGTDFIPLSLLQVAFRSSVYNMDWSDFIAPIHRFNPNYLRYITQGQIWNHAAVEAGIEAKKGDGASGGSKTFIDSRRIQAGYSSANDHPGHEVILWHGRFNDKKLYETPMFRQMWEQYGRTDDPMLSDVTYGILDRKWIIRGNPTPYGSWHHGHKIGHYIEFELEALAYGVGALGGALQKDMNRILRRVNDTELFSLYNMHFVGRGAELKNTNLQVFPWSMIPVAGDVNQIKEIRPQIEGIINGLKLLADTRQEFRGVTHAVDILQAVLSGATATESSLAQPEALRAISLCAEVNADAVIKPHLQTMWINRKDQNPYDQAYVQNVEFIPKTTTDRDFRPEHTKAMLELLSLVTSIRNQMPLDFNPMGILKYAARAAGINPRDLREPRPQMDRILDAMRRINGNSDLKNEIGGEMAGANANVSGAPRAIPNSPLQAAQ